MEYTEEKVQELATDLYYDMLDKHVDLMSKFRHANHEILKLRMQLTAFENSDATKNWTNCNMFNRAVKECEKCIRRRLATGLFKKSEPLLHEIIRDFKSLVEIPKTQTP